MCSLRCLQRLGCPSRDAAPQQQRFGVHRSSQLLSRQHLSPSIRTNAVQPVKRPTASTTQFPAEPIQQQAEASHTTPHDAAKPQHASKGTLLGAMALVVGSTVGAGMLALPAVSVGPGFVPTASTLGACWVLLTVNALLISEVNIRVHSSIDSSQRRQGEIISITKMAGRTLGPHGAGIATLVYMFLASTLLVAYTAKGGAVLHSVLQETVPTAACDAVFAAGMAALLLSGTANTDNVNKACTAGLLGLFAAILATVGSHGDYGTLFTSWDWQQAGTAFPVLYLSLVYHDLIPVLCSYLDFDRARIRTAIVAGSFLPLLMFMSWDAAALAVLPSEVTDAARGVSGSSGGVPVVDPLQVIMNMDQSGLMFPAVQSFSFMAIVTSFIGSGLGLSSYYFTEIGTLYDKHLQNILRESNDGTGWRAMAARIAVHCMQPAAQHGSAASTADASTAAVSDGSNDAVGAEDSRVQLRMLALTLTIGLPLVVAMNSSNAFFQATHFAGAYGMTFMYGLLPPLMAWRLFTQPSKPSPATKRTVAQRSMPVPQQLQPLPIPVEQTSITRLPNFMSNAFKGAATQYSGRMLGGAASVAATLVVGKVAFENGVFSGLFGGINAAGAAYNVALPDMAALDGFLSRIGH